MVYLQRRRLLIAIVTALIVFVVIQLGLAGPLGYVSPILSTNIFRSRPAPLPWNQLTLRYPVAAADMLQLPSGPVVDIPKIQHKFTAEDAADREERLARRKAVKEAFQHSWKGYSKYAWLHDEVTPVSKSFKDPFGNWGATLVDNLDTLLIMGMDREFASAVAALKKIDFSRAGIESLNVFETTIRYLGGLLAAHDLSKGKYPILLEKATQLGEMLYHAFDTPNRMPVTRWSWSTKFSSEQEASTFSLAAELGSLSLEFTRLSQLTGNTKYFDAIQRVTDEFERGQNFTKIAGLWPVIINAGGLTYTEDAYAFGGDTFTLGGMADSLYEYLPKEHMLLGGQTQQYRSMYEKVLAAAKEHLFFRPYNPQNLDILVSGSAQRIVTDDIQLTPEGGHLTCFVGGMVAIAAKIFSQPAELETARRLVEGCIWASSSTVKGIHPELFRAAPCKDPKGDCTYTQERWYNGVNMEQRSLDGPTPSSLDERAEKLIEHYRLPPGFTDVRDRRYLLRPEVIESLFIMYRITGEKHYPDTAWRIFENIKKYCKTDIGFAGEGDVTLEEASLIDSSESFWMAETLKYLFLIFSESHVVDLDEFVLNTEAHPLIRPRASHQT